MQGHKFANDLLFEHRYNSPWNIWAKFSTICKYLDEEIKVWTEQGIVEAVKYLLNENTPLFGSLTRQMSEYPELKCMLKAVVFQGKRISYLFLSEIQKYLLRDLPIAKKFYDISFDLD